MARSELRSVGGTLTNLHRVLEGWCDLQSKYAQIVSKPAYYDTELANTSLLVSAANAIHGWTGIAEMSVVKRDLGKGVKGFGQADAYISYGLSSDWSDFREYVIELKQVFMQRSNIEPEISNNGYRDKLRKAEEAVKAIKFKNNVFDKKCTYLFGAYLVPSYDPRKHKIKRKALFKNLEQHCKSNFDAFAVFSPALEKSEVKRKGKSKKSSGVKYSWQRRLPIVAFVLNEHVS